MKELPKTELFFIRSPTEKGFYQILERLKELGFRKSIFAEIDFSFYSDNSLIYVSDSGVYGCVDYSLYLSDYQHSPLLRMNDLFE